MCVTGDTRKIAFRIVRAHLAVDVCDRRERRCESRLGRLGGGSAISTSVPSHTWARAAQRSATGEEGIEREQTAHAIGHVAAG